MKKIIYLLLFSTFTIHASAQFFKSSSEKKLLKHIIFLADDKQEGRMTGSPGELTSALYIGDVFKKAGAKPGNGDSYLQDFEFTESVEPTENTWLKVDGQLWTGGTDYYPIDGTSSGVVNADLFFAGFGIKAP